MPIVLHGTPFYDIQVGSTPINSVWVGANKVWERFPYRPDTGWEDASRIKTTSGYNPVATIRSNVLTVNYDVTLKITVSANSNHYHGEKQFVEFQSDPGGGYPDGLLFRWGYDGSPFGTVYTASLSRGDDIRMQYRTLKHDRACSATTTIMDANNQALDTSTGYVILDV